MNLLLAKRVVVRVSQLYNAKVSALSRAEISSKINEIKYLADKKKTSKLTIKREIQSLEHKLEGVFELQHNIADERKKQSQKEATLKKRIVQLEHQLELGKDKSIHKKVERLSSILSDHIVKQKVKQDVEHLRFANSLQSKLKKTEKQELNLPKSSLVNRLHQTRLEQAQHQIDKLKKQLETNKNNLDEMSKQILEEKIHLLEIKLGMHLERIHHPVILTAETQTSPETTSPGQISEPTSSIIENPQNRHTILMAPPPQKIEHLPPELASRLVSEQNTDQIGKRQIEVTPHILPPPFKRRIN